MSEQFTKGPWKNKDNYVFSPLFDEDDDSMCMSIAVACAGVADATANANLIAAAPDMYAALECACDQYCIGYAGDSLVKCEDCIILKALRKARGEAE